MLKWDIKKKIAYSKLEIFKPSVLGISGSVLPNLKIFEWKVPTGISDENYNFKKKILCWVKNKTCFSPSKTSFKSVTKNVESYDFFFNYKVCGNIFFLVDESSILKGLNCKTRKQNIRFFFPLVCLSRIYLCNSYT